MAIKINETHDPNLTSWVESSNISGNDFPIQNLPFGVFKRTHVDEEPRIGVAIGDQILDIAACVRANLIDGPAAESCFSSHLNDLLALGPESWSILRLHLSRLLRADSSVYQAHYELSDQILVPMSQATLLLPVEIGDYTDAYASIYHATNVGRLFRPDNPLLPNYKFVPVAYHGRASSIAASGSEVRRPKGQIRQLADDQPVFMASTQLDYEVEAGIIIGPGNQLGAAIPISQAEQYIFGICLVNDWSARDIQRWEYQPLGPFLAKSFMTSVSPWIVTMEALAPYRSPAFSRPLGDPQPLPYLFALGDQAQGGIDLTVEVYLCSSLMREQHIEPMLLSRSNLTDMYWTFAQIIAHHTSNGCNLCPGDMIASGTISGPSEDSLGSLLEITRGGKELLALPSGERRAFLEDGDEVIMRGFCERGPYARIGLGECQGCVLPAELPFKG
jgi:fumarylacetoacetase